MSIYEEKLEGREFDWFAIDGEGNIALFATAGEGTIPNLVIENYAEHDAIAVQLESPNLGSSEVWSDFAKLGFFVFDWDLHGGPYKREQKPTSTMSVQLRNTIMAMGSIPSLPVKFTEITELVVGRTLK
ncbi:hypothetical protein [Pseudoalteromonas luteoviolacea]|uniref:Uncharacterized protein n=1 Tax=Pseudoalteromonas luteoviolacea (strain 2ta16) TaxID=1353533 RepID=V4H223_PSEL2|nr:hypothetical protein [Pseudoalteromonas luteoviolacea]ESP91486.1 hypothetical protein PL2TA16_00285 [Pseudoalteromonas luteoviolacea 2ta16]KZN40135.1 hypothetical protein N483_18270 [Pseudoalteromonas luteoviolacea NCIMB 1944]